MIEEIQPFLPTDILHLIPHRKPFRFIDDLAYVNADGCEGSYTFRPDEFFYQGHFPGYPITPGVILLETMCQIGMAPLGLYLISREVPRLEILKFKMLFCESQLELLKPVYPGTKVIVKSQKVYWRFKKLKCKVEMYDEAGHELARTTAAGIGGMVDF